MKWCSRAPGAGATAVHCKRYSKLNTTYSGSNHLEQGAGGKTLRRQRLTIGREQLAFTHTSSGRTCCVGRFDVAGRFLIFLSGSRCPAAVALSADAITRSARKASVHRAGGRYLCNVRVYGCRERRNGTLSRLLAGGGLTSFLCTAVRRVSLIPLFILVNKKLGGNTYPCWLLQGPTAIDMTVDGVVILVIYSSSSSLEGGAHTYSVYLRTLLQPTQ